MKNKELFTIPNFITLANLCFGFLAILQDNVVYAVACICIAAIMDVFDGLFARLLHADGEIGRQLDSLADIVSFGIAPAFIYFNQIEHVDMMTKIGVFVYISACALRLAKFNVIEGSKDFSGLPTPAAALLLLGFIVANHSEIGWVEPVFDVELAYILVPFIISILMISNVTMFSVKSVKEGFMENIGLVICIFTFIATFFYQKELALLNTMLCYILMSFIINLRTPKKEVK